MTVGFIFVWLLISPYVVRLMASLARSLDPEHARLGWDSRYVWLGAAIVLTPVALLVARWRRSRKLAAPPEELLLKRPLTRQARLVNRVVAGVIFAVAVGVASAGYSISRSATLKVAQSTVHWSRVKGVVTVSRLEERRTTNGWTYRRILRYAYAVNGTEYTGFHLDAPLVDGYWTESPRAFVDTTSPFPIEVPKYPVGRTVDVWYDPANPSRAVLEPGIPYHKVTATATGLVFLYGFAAISIAIGVVLLRMREGSAGSVKARREWLAQHDLTEESAARPPGRMRLR
jgi:hypothetical protein